MLCVGGGSGGHVTPVLAVINELAKQDSDLSVVFVTDKAFLKQTQGLVQERMSVPVTVKTIPAGKFRRYKDMALWKQVIRPDVGGKNLVDMFKTASGVIQSIALVKREKPDVVFAKGGYVSLPIGYAAHLLKIPLVIHDSDVRPGLTNRVLSRWATRIATGMPAENYTYDSKIAKYTGVPVGAGFRAFSKEEQRLAKLAYGVSGDRPLVVATGGGLGAKEINQAMLEVAPRLVQRGCSVYHITGKGPFEKIQSQVVETDMYKVVPFVYEGMSQLYGAADVVVTRASATTLQELAAAVKASVIVPNSSLGDQIENAKFYQQQDAAVMLRDEDLTQNPSTLLDTVVALLENDEQRKMLGEAISKYAKPEAARDVAQLILEAKE